jgi:hypothetical protein
MQTPSIVTQSRDSMFPLNSYCIYRDTQYNYEVLKEVLYIFSKD